MKSETLIGAVLCLFSYLLSWVSLIQADYSFLVPAAVSILAAWVFTSPRACL